MFRNIVCLAIVLCGAVQAATADDAKPVSPDEAAIHKAIDSYIAAFNRGDAQAMAQHYSEQGSYVDPITGDRLVGREAIAKGMTLLFAEGAKPKLSVEVDSVRLLDDKVAVEEGTAAVVREDEAPELSTYLAIHVKKDGKWSLDSVRETMLPEPEVDESSPLDDLSWMIGRWIDKSDEATVETICDWTLNKAFITRTFSVTVKGQPAMSGTQVIAWDPSRERVRSWVFDSDGTFGEGIWTQQENRWTIRASNTLADGKKGTAVHIISKIDDNSFTWQSIAREVDGEILPNVDPITIVRKPVD
ncbi:MAG TPA: SgcJ/EcaC family oxidoreductase [Pirellulales bacterium]|jgi:uncharacterized protein (TIGR02246 family)